MSSEEIIEDIKNTFGTYDNFCECVNFQRAEDMVIKRQQTKELEKKLRGENEK